MSRSILIVEDDDELAKVLQLNLHQAGFLVERVANGTDGLAEAQRGVYDAVILDLLLPGLPGLEVCRALRLEKNPVPILMLTANDEEIYRVLGLELGADDYIPKPFSIPELIARVRAVFRRIDMTRDLAATSGSDRRSYGELAIDLVKRQAFLRGREVSLTPSEFDLLALLAVNPGRPFTRMEIIKGLWEYTHEGYEHAVNSHIKRLRDKIETDPKNPEYVLTVWGIGYKFTDSIPPGA